MIATENLLSLSFLYFQNILLQHRLSIWNEYSYSEIKSGLLLKIGRLIQIWPSKSVADSRDLHSQSEKKKTQQPKTNKQQQQ